MLFLLAARATQVWGAVQNLSESTLEQSECCIVQMYFQGALEQSSMMMRREAWQPSEVMI